MPLHPLNTLCNNSFLASSSSISISSSSSSSETRLLPSRTLIFSLQDRSFFHTHQVISLLQHKTWRIIIKR
ncbi:hypothetical protein SDJN03_02170, partial [Cucurbita argyrosperma subsp. sororia]